MVRPRTKTAATCSNPKCVFFQKETGKDILNRGKNKAGHHRYFCNHCKTWSVETANTPFYHKHLSKDDIITICTLLAAQHGIRSIEQITRHHRDTIGHLLDDLALHAPYVHSLLLDEQRLSPAEMTQMWLSIQKSRRTLSRKGKIQIEAILLRYSAG